MSRNFEVFSDHHKPLIEAAIKSALIFDCDDERSILQEAMAYAALGTAKRIRPLMVLASFSLFSEQLDTIMPLAVATELIHTYSLIHDDLPAMDNDDLRRGRLTCHKKYGEDVAILAGDTLSTFSFELVAKDLPPHFKPESVVITLYQLANAL